MNPHAWYGCRRDVRDARDLMFAKPKGLLRVPSRVDLREWCPPVMDQGDLGSCTANAITAGLRWHVIRAGGKHDEPLSRLALYYEERRREGTTSDDAGAEIRTGIKIAKELGVPREQYWPYDVSKFAIDPDPELYQTAWLFGSLRYERVPVNATAIRSALAANGPVVVGVSLYDSFESDAVAKTGDVPMPDLEKEQLVGGHAMLCVGYDIAGKTFTVMNSWAKDWGDAGFCRFPERYLGSTLFASDLWAIKPNL